MKGGITEWGNLNEVGGKQKGRVYQNKTERDMRSNLVTNHLSGETHPRGFYGIAEIVVVVWPREKSGGSISATLGGEIQNNQQGERESRSAENQNGRRHCRDG